MDLIRQICKAYIALQFLAYNVTVLNKFLLVKQVVFSLVLAPCQYLQVAQMLGFLYLQMVDQQIAWHLVQ